jgi:hypothetical protein
LTPGDERFCSESSGVLAFLYSSPASVRVCVCATIATSLPIPDEKVEKLSLSRESIAQELTRELTRQIVVYGSLYGPTNSKTALDPLATEVLGPKSSCEYLPVGSLPWQFQFAQQSC